MLSARPLAISTLRKVYRKIEEQFGKSLKYSNSQALLISQIDRGFSQKYDKKDMLSEIYYKFIYICAHLWNCAKEQMNTFFFTFF